jgi:plastocyanin
MNQIVKAALPVVFLCLALPACAEDHVITQADKTFSESKITVAVGDTVTFMNDDSTTHNVQSNTAGFEMDLGAQAPGASSTVTLKQAGEVTFRCAIHPKMKLKVKVE